MGAELPVRSDVLLACLTFVHESLELLDPVDERQVLRLVALLVVVLHIAVAFLKALAAPAFLRLVQRVEHPRPGGHG